MSEAYVCGGKNKSHEGIGQTATTMTKTTTKKIAVSLSAIFFILVLSTTPKMVNEALRYLVSPRVESFLSKKRRQIYPTIQRAHTKSPSLTYKNRYFHYISE